MKFSIPKEEKPPKLREPKGPKHRAAKKAASPATDKAVKDWKAVLKGMSKPKV